MTEDTPRARLAAGLGSRPKPAFVARHNIDVQQYQAVFDELVPQGFPPTVSGYTVGGKHRFPAVFEQDRIGAFVARHGTSSW